MRIIIKYSTGESFTIRSAFMSAKIRRGSNVLRITKAAAGSVTHDEVNHIAGQDFDKFMESMIQGVKPTADFGQAYVLGELKEQVGCLQFEKLNLVGVESVQFASTGMPPFMQLNINPINGVEYSRTTFKAGV